MLNCKQANELMSKSMDEKLPFSQLLGLKLHAMMCNGCANFMRQIRFMRRAANYIGEHKDGCDGMHLSSQARERIAKAIKDIRVS